MEARRELEKLDGQAPAQKDNNRRRRARSGRRAAVVVERTKLDGVGWGGVVGGEEAVGLFILACSMP